MSVTPMQARKAQRDRDRAEAEARLLQEAPGSTLSATIAEGSATTQPEDHPLPRTPIDHSVAAGPHEVKARQVRLQDALGLTDASQTTMQPPQTEVADLQHQVDGLKLQLTEITVLLTKIIASKTDDVDDAPAPVTAPASLRSRPAPLKIASLAPALAPTASASALASTIAPLAAQQFQHPSTRLVPKVVLNVHDVVLFCAHPSRFTPNVYALYAWARKQNEDTFLAFENGVAKQGYVAAQAIFDFRTTIEAWLTPMIWTMTGMVIVGMTKERNSVAAATIEDLVCLAVHEYEDIDAVIASVASTGLYDRTKCSSKGFTELPGLALFDPSANGSAELWRGLLTLIEVFNQHAAGAMSERMKHAAAWEGSKQGDLSISAFITVFDGLFKLLEQHGGQYTEQQRVKQFLQNADDGTRDAFALHVSDQKRHGNYDIEIHSNWGLFTNAMDRIGQSMSDHGVEPVVTHDVGGAAAEGAPNLTRGRPECNNWAYTGRCAYADDCRFEHIGEAGYKSMQKAPPAPLELSTLDKAKRAYAKENVMLFKNVDVKLIEDDLEGWAKKYDEVVDMLKAKQDNKANAPKRQTWADLAPGADTTRFGNYHMAAGDPAASER